MPDDLVVVVGCLSAPALSSMRSNWNDDDMLIIPFASSLQSPHHPLLFSRLTNADGWKMEASRVALETDYFNSFGGTFTV